MRKDCDSCKHEEFFDEYCDDCCSSYGNQPSKWEPASYYEPDTRADAIRRMNDEELEDFLWRFDLKEVAREDVFLVTKKKLSEWLQQPEVFP